MAMAQLSLTQPTMDDSLCERLRVSFTVTNGHRDHNSIYEEEDDDEEDLPPLPPRLTDDLESGPPSVKEWSWSQARVLGVPPHSGNLTTHASSYPRVRTRVSHGTAPRPQAHERGGPLAILSEDGNSKERRNRWRGPRIRHEKGGLSVLPADEARQRTGRHTDL
ncbi:hypothetical protein AAFF_G00281340 [Aldrovandia affinis]|uniref:Uncharacterized protein n=1 Tax=Aldrovandia affinis TaxID=143900 RepID=A0AAD7W1L7_9TELE|nr:hypothetical protein AAFF_G00281340 [Aldrovandia affinis]